MTTFPGSSWRMLKRGSPLSARSPGRSEPRSCAAVILRLTIAMLGLVLALATTSTAQETVDGVAPIPGFDHSQFGIPLTGAHAKIICESCHINNQLKGTPATCVGCHNGTRAKGKPASHPPAGNNCTQCHTTKNFVPFAFDHTSITQPCATCHNGAKARGKPADHIAATATCDNCHVTTGFKDARVDHRDVIGTCISCHNGKVAPGKIKGHVQASDDCGSCHSTLTFKNPVFDHASAGQPCATCHNGAVRTSQPRDRTPPDWHRIVDMNDCESCHVPGISFSGALMDHSRANSEADCVACHFTFGQDSPPNPNQNSSGQVHRPDQNCFGCHTLP